MHTLFLLLVMPAIMWGQGPTEMAAQLGILTLIPPALSIILAFLTRRVYFSLFLGIWAGTILLSTADGASFGDLYNSFNQMITTIVSVLSDSWNASIIAQLITISGLIAVISKNGGSYAIATAIAKKAKTARSAQLFSGLTALFIFFDDYANCLITGPVMRPVTDKLKVSREKLSFIVDATAAPIAGIALISTWIGYELGVLKDAYTIAGITDPNTYVIFIETIPYRFYNLLMIGFVVLVAVMNRDFGPMLKAEQRARQTGVTVINPDLDAADSFLDPEPNIKYRVSNALIPIFVLIFGSFFGIWYSGSAALASEGTALHPELSKAILQVLGASDVIMEMFKAAMLASVVAMVLSAATKTMTLFQSIDVWVAGAKNMLSTVLVLLLAWTISSTIKQLGTSAFLIGALGDFLNPMFIPALTFMLSALISFATGTAFGTMGIVLPLSVPLAATLTGDANSFITLVTAGSVLSGAIVGDHCSPISDTTILSSGGAGCSLIDHVDTQFPYALLVTGVSVLFGYVLVAFGVPVYVSYILGFVSLALFLHFVGKNPETSK